MKSCGQPDFTHNGSMSEWDILAEDNQWPSSMATEIEYLRKHGEAGRVSYVPFRKLGIPLGSGSIECRIRRVFNNRMKGNGMFWRPDNAETMLQLRCQVVSDRWDESIAEMRNMNRKTSHQDWRWLGNASVDFENQFDRI
jgi:hypothetical protein